MDSLLRHGLVFSILFIPLFIIYAKSSFLIILFIGLPVVGELIQLSFPKEWMFKFEFQDITFNFIGATLGGLIWWSTLNIVKGVKKEQVLHK